MGFLSGFWHRMNYAAYRYYYTNARSLDHRVPIDVSLELSSQCNLACEYCYHSDPKKLPFARGQMKFETACKIIAESYAFAVNSLKFNWKGESTMHPAFCKLTKMAKELASGGTFIDRITNSNFKFDINRDDIFEGLSYQTKVKVSFDSFIPEVMEKQRRLSSHEKTMANIDKFYNWPGRNNTLVIQAVRTQLNKDEDLEGEVKKRWPSAKLSVRDMVSGRVQKNLDELEVKQRDLREREPCIQAYARLVFNHEGKAFPCCVDIGEKLCLGDINTHNIEQIFTSYTAKTLRSNLESRSAFVSDPCKTCSSFESYKGYEPPRDS